MSPAPPEPLSRPSRGTPPLRLGACRPRAPYQKTPCSGLFAQQPQDTNRRRVAFSADRFRRLQAQTQKEKERGTASWKRNVQQDRNIRQAKWLCQTNMEKDYLSFLKEFPAQKAEIEKCIACLRETADAISKTHKDCTIANIVASGAGVTSGILTMLGLTLTPVTAGGSLILTATGLGLGAAAATTGVSARISEQIISSKHSNQSQELIDGCVKSLNKCMESLLATLLCLDLDSRLSPDGKEPTMEEKLKPVLKPVAEQLPKAVSTVMGAVMGIKANVQALKVAQANPAWKVLAKQATAAGQASRASFKGIEQVEKAFSGTALAMSKGTRVLGAVAAGVCILIDTISIVQSAIHLAKGAEAEKATKIREAANKLEEVLQNLSKQYEQLKRDRGCTLSRP